jgi:hypothetical protein
LLSKIRICPKRKFQEFQQNDEEENKTLENKRADKQNCYFKKANIEAEDE